MDNISSVNIKQTSDMIKLCLNMKKHKVNIPLMLWGKHGIGKTSIVKQIGESVGYDVVFLNLANMTVEDLLGQIDGNGGYYKPTWLNKSNKPTIYFLDEINRAPKYVIQSIFTLVNEGRIHNFSINEMDYVISACNPTEEYEVTCFEDGAFISRFAHIKIVPDKMEFINYISTLNIKNTIIQETLKKSVSLYNNESFNLGFNVSSDNRSLEKIAFIFEYCDNTTIENVGRNLIESLVGFDAMSIIMETWKNTNKKEINPKNILNGKIEFKNDEIDTINVVNAKLIEYIRNNELTSDDKNGLINYVKYIPKDLQVAFIKDLINVKSYFVDLFDFEYIKSLTEISKDKKK